VPVTPFHLGPGMLLKSLAHDRFSFLTFGISQVIMDLQPLFAMLTGIGPIHGSTHTYAGATLIAPIAAVISKLLVGPMLVYWNRNFEGPDWLGQFYTQVSAPVLLGSAFIGTYSHIFLDSMMHADMQPFFPLDYANSLLSLTDAYSLHIYCLALGIVGIIVYGALRFVRGK